MKLTSGQVKQFRAIGHRLNPVVIVSKGLTDNVRAEMERALEDHELIKIRINAGDRNEKKSLALEACRLCNAELIQLIGHVALIYRAAQRPNAKLSNLLRHQELL